LAGGIAWLALCDYIAAQARLNVLALIVLDGIYLVVITAILLRVADADSRTKREQLRREQLTGAEVVRRLAQLAALHDGDTALHCDRIGSLAFELAREMGLASEKCEMLRHAAVLHDLGKVGVDRAILSKPGALTLSEREEVQRHVELGAAILEGARHPVLEVALIAIRTHHEWWDGRGYPEGLTGNAIPIEGRIVAVCDVFDALTTQRPYREALGPDVALDYLREASGVQFDPLIVDAFERCFPRLLEIYPQEAYKAIAL